MAQHNFRINAGAGGFYVSKSGSDSNPGTDPNAPRKTLPALVTNVLCVIGSGIYSAKDLGTYSSGGTYVADGYVKIKSESIATTVINGPDFVYQNIHFEACIFGYKAAANNTFASNCKFVNCSGLGAGTNTSRHRSISGCIIINSSMGGASGGTITATSNIVINGYLSIGAAAALCSSNYLDKSSILIISTPMLPGNFRNNNIQGIIVMARTDATYANFAIQDQLAGTPQDNGYNQNVKWLTEANLTAENVTGTIAGWNTAASTCMNRDPKFIDAGSEIFALQSDSPHIRAGLSGVNIGGTLVGTAVYNSDDGNASGTRVIPSAQIDTSAISVLRLLAGQVEGYVDYMFFVGQIKLLRMDVNSLLAFDSDFAGGTFYENYNVPDSQPLTADYAHKTLTTVAGATVNEVIVATGLITAGQWIRVNAQPRLVDSATPDGLGNDVIAFTTALLAIIGVGIVVTYGTEVQLASLTPNRLTYQMRTKTSVGTPSFPLVDSEWDNGVSGSYGVAGVMFDHFIGRPMGLIISGGVVYGSADPASPSFTITNDIIPEWAHVRVYLRDNYSSNGL